MTPYELRFQIFRQAIGLAESKHAASCKLVEQHNLSYENKWEYPPFPSYEKIEELATKINDFVSFK